MRRWDQLLEVLPISDGPGIGSQIAFSFLGCYETRPQIKPPSAHDGAPFVSWDERSAKWAKFLEEEPALTP